MMSDLQIIAFFMSGNAPGTGLNPVINGWEVPSNIQVISSQLMTELSSGFYYYTFSNYSEDKDYAFLADGGSNLPWYNRWIYTTNESATSSSEGGGGGKSYIYPVGKKSPWTHTQRDKVLKRTEETLNKVNDLLENINKGFDDTKKIIKKEINKSIKELDIRHNFLTAKLDDITNLLNSLHSDEMNKLEKLSSSAKTLINNLRKEIMNKISDNLESILNKLDYIEQSIKNSISDSKTSIISKSDEDKQSIISKINLIQSILESWKSNIEHVPSISDIKDINDSIIELVTLIAKTLPDELLEELVSDEEI